MIKEKDKLAIYMEKSVDSDYAKTGYAVMQFLTSQVVCVIDSKCKRSHVTSESGKQYRIPVVASIDSARESGATVLVLGTAPSGGRFPDEWSAPVASALASGMSVVNGLHDNLYDKFKDQIVVDDRQWIWDVRQPSSIAPPIASAKAAESSNARVLLVGTDMAIGKMSTGLILNDWLKNQDRMVGEEKQTISTGFVATGQVGIILTGSGIALDSFKVDHACGAVEREVLKYADRDIVLIEGQGSLLHPGSSATLALMRGGCPNRMIMCHRADKKTLRGPKHIKIPNLSEFIKLNEAVAGVCGSLTLCDVVGVSLNTRYLSDSEARDAIKKAEEETGLPADDVFRFGAAKLGHALVDSCSSL